MGVGPRLCRESPLSGAPSLYAKCLGRGVGLTDARLMHNLSGAFYFVANTTATLVLCSRGNSSILLYILYIYTVKVWQYLLFWEVLFASNRLKIQLAKWCAFYYNFILKCSIICKRLKFKEKNGTGN